MLSLFIVLLVLAFSFMTVFAAGWFWGFRFASKVALNTLDEMIQETKDKLLASRREEE